jgi:iron-sulfur cluster repair protein YtfE (RIC family)
MQLEHADTVLLLHAVHVAMVRCLASSSEPAARDAVERIVHVERTLCEHMHLENNELFARALEASASR